jgi:hypothetical protein
VKIPRNKLPGGFVIDSKSSVIINGNFRIKTKIITSDPIHCVIFDTLLYKFFPSVKNYSLHKIVFSNFSNKKNRRDSCSPHIIGNIA